MAEYGLPYMGSKSSICNDLIRIFPKVDHFYDLFGGGFSVTHAMIERRFGHYKHFHFNELRPGICDLIQDCIAGKYSYENFKPPFVTREEFQKKKELDPYIKLCWSFGNNGKTYLFGKDIENQKRSLHNAVVFNEFDDFAKELFGMSRFNDGLGIKDRRLFISSRTELQQLLQLEQLERLEQLQRLERLQQLGKLNFYNKSYDQIDIQKNSVIYCDPPYAGTAEYDNSFNTKKFLDWADAQQNPVFISEYRVSDPRFSLVFEKNKRSLLSSQKNNLVKKERVYLNKAGLKLL